MSDYKSDQDKFFDQLRDLTDFADKFFDQLRDLTDFATEANERERQQKYKSIIDKIVKSFVEAEMFGPDDEARAEVIRVMKERCKLPDDYTYPGGAEEEVR